MGDGGSQDRLEPHHQILGLADNGYQRQVYNTDNLCSPNIFFIEGTNVMKLFMEVIYEWAK